MKNLKYLAPAASLFLVGCTNSLIDRSLIFSTNTSLGIDVSVNPSQTDSPAKLQIGYKRTEGVLNPVFYNLEGDANAKADPGRKVTDYYLKDAYSVIAKFQGTATASGGASANTSVSTTTTTAAGAAAPSNTGALNASVQGGMTLSQWFATGEAAKILARYGAGALSDNPGVAAAISMSVNRQSPTLLDSGDTSPVVISIANQLFGALKNISTGSANATVKAEAARIVSLLDSSALVGQVPANFQGYLVADGVGHTYKQTPPTSKIGFDSVVGYLNSLSLSIGQLKTILSWPTATLQGAAAPIDAATRQALINELASEAADEQKWQTLFQKDPAVRSMFEILLGKQ